MGAALAALWAFIQALPKLIKIYDNIDAVVEDGKLDSFLGGLDEVTKAAAEIKKNPNMSFEEKRAKRRDLLVKSRALWDSALG